MLHDELLPLLASAIQDLAEAAIGHELVTEAQGKLERCFVLARPQLMTAHPSLVHQSAADALRAAAAIALERAPTRVVVHAPEYVQAPGQALALAIAAELLRNVAQHAHASRSDVHLHVEASFAALIVEDNGRGAAAEALEQAGTHGHVGALNVRRRSRELGGRITWTTPVPGGTRAHLIWPTGVSAE